MSPVSFDDDDDEVFDADDSYGDEAAPAPPTAPPDDSFGDEAASAPPPIAKGASIAKGSTIDPDDCDKRSAGASSAAPTPAAPSKYERHLNFAMLFFFVVGSVLYLVCAVSDYRWGQTLLEVPEWMRSVDDDAAWVRYRLEEEYGDVSGLEDGPDWDAERRELRMKRQSKLGGVKRRLMREQGVAFGLDFLFGDDKHDNNLSIKAEQIALEPPSHRKLQSTPEELYYDLDWDCLPPEIQEAYAVLGYYEDSWNNAWPVASDSMFWYQLTPEMQEAALFIGYTEEIWCSTDDGAYADDELAAEAVPATGSPTKPPTESPTPVPSAGPTASPAPPPSASPTLSPSGNPTSSPAPTLSGFILDEDGNVVPRPTASPSRVPTETPTSSPTGFPSVIPSWMPSFLPSVEPSVIPSSIPSEAPTPSPTGNITAGALLPDDLPDAIYFDEWWKDLPPEIQDAYTVLGWNETAWNTAMPVASDNMTWAELSEDQQEAAGVLGYTQEIWDAGVSDEFADIATNSTDAVDYEDYAWDELPPEVKAAAETLGWTQDKWDNGNGEAWSDAFYWSQLSPEAQEAAAVFGYDELSWNSGGDPELAALLEEAGGEYVSADDDYVFTIGRTGVHVSEYQILYFFAALCFVFTGILELAIYKAPFHFLMILAGVFGVASAVYVEEDVRLANILDSVSVHLFLFEGVGLLLKNRYKELMEEEQWTRWLYTFADSQFFLGAILDVIMSYFYLFEESADWDTALQITWVFSACLWVNCSLIYTGIFIKETIEDR